MISATRVRCSWLGKSRTVLDKFLLRFKQESGSKQAHLVTEQSLAYLLHCSQSTRTASAAPFPGPAAGSWCAHPGPGRRCTSERSQPSLPACSTKHQLHEKEVLQKGTTRTLLQQSVNMPTCPTALPITVRFSALPPFPHTKPLNSSVPSTASFKFNNLLVWKQAPVSQILIKIWHRRSFITLSASKAIRELKNTNKLTHYMHYKGHSC